MYLAVAFALDHKISQADEQRINLILRPWSQSHAMAQGLMLFAGNDDAEPLASGVVHRRFRRR